MEITTDFPGGNIDILAVEQNKIKVKPQFRDTDGEWFYWAFCVSGAAKKSVTFDFSPYGYIGYHGPAVSGNLKDWRWAGEPESPRSFTYTFGEHEDKLYFAHDMLYGTERFDIFADRMHFKPEKLCVSEKGGEVPFLKFGTGKNAVLLTARHHCCESTGSYILEGVLEELYNAPMPDFKVIAVPFVDMDGVADGDQGKNRNPHDHNRDYAGKPIYASVKAIKKIAESENIRYAFDFHSPWHTGGRNDKLFFVRGSEKDLPKYGRLGKILEEETEKETGGNPIKYNSGDDINPGEDWNTLENGLNLSFSRFCAGIAKVELSLAVETPYFGCGENKVSQNKLIRTGRAFARSLKKYEGEK